MGFLYFWKTRNVKAMKILSFFCLIFFLCSFNMNDNLKSVVKTPTSDLDRMQLRHFLSEAIRAQLESDEISTETVRKIFENSALWVSKCPICDGVRVGVSKFEKVNLFPTGNRLEVFFEGSNEAQKSAWKSYTEKAVESHFERLNLPVDEKKVMQKTLENGREQGMKLAPKTEGFFCSSCDGACGKK